MKLQRFALQSLALSLLLALGATAWADEPGPASSSTQAAKPVGVKVTATGTKVVNSAERGGRRARSAVERGVQRVGKAAGRGVNKAGAHVQRGVEKVTGPTPPSKPAPQPPAQP